MILRLLAIATLALTVAVLPAEAAKGKKGGAGRALTRLDKDHNGTIDGQEVARVQNLYATLAALDTDKNGELSAEELAAAKVPVGKGGKKKAQ